MKFLLIVLLAVVSRSVISLRPTGKVVTVDSFVWNLHEPSEVKINAKSPITIDFVAQIAPQSDSIKGKNLWRLGIFGSEHNDGHGERVGFKSQILKPKQASKRATKGSPLKMKNIFSRFDLSQIGCSEVRYFCVEFARNPDSTVDFELRSGAELDNIVSCKEMECRRSNANATMTGPETSSALVVPSPTVRLSGYGWSIRMTGYPDRKTFTIELFVNPHPRTDNIRGSGLWRVGIFLSNAIRGRSMVRSQYQPDILTAADKSKPLISGEHLTFSYLHAVLNTTGVGCPGVDLQFLCLELAKGENAIPDFQLSDGPLIRCTRLECSNPEDYTDPEELPTPQPAARVQDLGMQILIKDACEDGSHNISMDVQVHPHASTDTIQGSDLWRLGVFLSNATSCPMAAAQYKSDILNATHKAKPLIAGEPLRFDDLLTNLNTSYVGCPESFLQYLCIEFDKGENPSPDFQLPEGRLIDCVAVNCTRPRKSFDDWFIDILRTALRGFSSSAEE